MTKRNLDFNSIGKNQKVIQDREADLQCYI